MPSIQTIQDLFDNGFDYEVTQFLAGNTPTIDSLRGLALRTFGEDWQGTPSTLLEFAQLVRQSMTAAENLTDEGLPPGFVVPGAPLTPGGPEFRTQGYGSSTTSQPDEAIASPNAHLPFQIDSDEIPTPAEILDVIRNDPALAASGLETNSPGLVKRLQDLQLEQQLGVNRDWEVAVTRIWRNLRSHLRV